jgi:hypothetical protein
LLVGNAAMVRFRLRLQLHEYELPAGLTVIGRATNCNLTIDDALLSREHAAVRVGEDRVTVRDLGSRNGTYVNGERIEDDVELHDGDRIKVGTTEMIFSRVVKSRRTLSATTGAVATCGKCRSAYVAPAPVCPRCGTASPMAPQHRTESQSRRDFWLSLEVELVNKAIAMFRFDEAEESILRLQTKLDELLAANKTFERPAIESALVAVVRFAHVRGTGRKIGWALDVMRKLDMVPGPELFALLAATPPILLEDAADKLSALIAHHSVRDLDGAERSCLQSLNTLRDDLIAFGAMRMHDTAPRAAVAVI